MYRIGEFSQIVGITAKTLRYYDAEEILSPSYRSKENGYRYYSESDIKKAEIITDMRKFNFTISEMKDALKNINGKDDFIDFLAEKVAITQDLITQYSELVSEMQEYLNEHMPEKKKPLNVIYTVSETEILSATIACIRFRGSYQEIGLNFERLYKAVQKYAAGAPLTCYYSLEFCEMADIEVCIPVSKEIYHSGITIRELRNAKAISVTHLGNYANLKYAYKALFDYANEHNLQYTIPLIEIYEKRRGATLAGNPEKYITQIYLPIVK